MNPEHHIEVLRRVLPTITTDAVREALLEFLMTGARPAITDTNAMMPGIDKMHERYVVHFLSPSAVNGASVLGVTECIGWLYAYVTETDDTHETRAP